MGKTFIFGGFIDNFSNVMNSNSLYSLVDKDTTGNDFLEEIHPSRSM